MRLSFTKLLFISLFLSACLLSGCGGGGGGGGSSENGGGNDVVSNITQANAIRDALAPVITNIQAIFTAFNPSIRSNIEVTEALYSVSTGEKLIELAKLSDTEFDKVTLDKFKSKFDNENLRVINSKLAVATNGSYTISLYCDTSAKNWTYMASEINGETAVGVSYICVNNSSSAEYNYVTFAFKVGKNGELEGRVFKFDQKDYNYSSYVDLFNLADIYGDAEKINYVPQKGEPLEVNYSEANNNNLAEDERDGEIIGVLFALKPVVENVSSVITLPAASMRGNIEVPSELNKTVGELKTLIPFTSINEFKNSSSLSNTKILVNNKTVSIKNYNNKQVEGHISVVVGRHNDSGLNIGMAVCTSGTASVITKFAAQPSGSVVVAAGNLDGDQENFKSTIIFRMKADASEIEGKTFGVPVEVGDTYTFDSSEYQTSSITGNATSFTYTHTDGGTWTVKYSGDYVD